METEIPQTTLPRVVTNEDIIKYMKMVESFLAMSVQKNWNESSMSVKNGKDEIALGNSGYTMADVRQYLTVEVFIALKNYDPLKQTKESTFVYGHLSKRVGSLMKKLTKHSKGYGFWTSNLEEVLGEMDSDC